MRGSSIGFAAAFAAALAPGARADEAKTFPEPGQGAGGAAGFGRVVSARPAEEGAWRFALRGAFFQGSDFPSVGTSRQIGGELAGAYGLLPGLELFGAYRNTSTSNARAVPAIILAQGDLTAGARGSLRWGGFSLGGEARGELRAPVGADAASLDASTLVLRALASQELDTGFGLLVLHANAGGAIGASEEAGRLDASQIYGIALSGYHRVLGSVGAQLQLGPVTPFLSFDLDLPVGVDAALLDGAGTTAFGAAAKRVQLGARVPVGAAGAFDLAVDLGAGDGVRGFARTSPYLAWAAFSYAFDASLYALPVPPPPPPAPPAPTKGSVAGLVRDPAGTPLARATISPVGASGGGFATGPDGRFVSRELAPGALTLTVECDGFLPQTVSTRIDAGVVAPIDVKLEPVPPPPPPELPPEPPPPPPAMGTLAGALFANEPVNAFVKVSGPQRTESRTRADGTFAFRLSPGRYDVVVLPDAHFARRTEIMVGEDAVTVVPARTEALPKKPRVAAGPDRLVVTPPLALDEKKSEPAAKDAGALAEVADALLRDGTKRLAIDVYAAPAKKGDPQAWADARAKALLAALVARGVPADRLEARGVVADPPKGAKKVPAKRVELRVGRSL